MKKLFTRVFAIAALAMGLIGSANASFLTIDRTITDITVTGGFPTGLTVLSSETYDLTTGTIVDFSVNGSHTPFSAANVGLTWGIDPIYGTPALVLGGLINGLSDPIMGTDDFIGYIDPMTGEMSSLTFSALGFPFLFFSTSIASTFSISDDFGVPEPGTLALGAIAALAGLTVRRKAAR